MLTCLDNQIFLMKRGSEGGANAGLEPYSEMYASQLAAVFCPDSVPYDVVNYHEKKPLNVRFLQMSNMVSLQLINASE